MNLTVDQCPAGDEQSVAARQAAAGTISVLPGTADRLSAVLCAATDLSPPVIGPATDNIVVRQSGIHGTGAFARCDLPKGCQVIEYVGEKISKTESARRIDADNEYIFTLDDDYDLDGKVDGNPARFINHSCAPNCEAEIDGHQVWIIALRDIKAGEELSFNYGYDLEDYLEHPCRCGAGQCVGYMVAEEYFELVRTCFRAAGEPTASAQTPSASTSRCDL